MLLAIDPGLSGTGCCVWDAHLSPVYAAVLTAPRECSTYLLRTNYLVEEIQGLVSEFDVMRLVCEFPEFQSGAGREMGWRKGDLQKLTFLIGSIYWATRPQVVFFPVSPSKWKGQLPKSVVEHRVIESLGKETCARLKLRTHAWDAAGIGLWAIKQGVCDELL